MWTKLFLQSFPKKGLKFLFSMKRCTLKSRYIFLLGGLIQFKILLTFSRNKFLSTLCNYLYICLHLTSFLTSQICSWKLISLIVYLTSDSLYLDSTKVKDEDNFSLMSSADSPLCSNNISLTPPRVFFFATSTFLIIWDQSYVFSFWKLEIICFLEHNYFISISMIFHI